MTYKNDPNDFHASVLRLQCKDLITECAIWCVMCAIASVLALFAPVSFTVFAIFTFMGGVFFAGAFSCGRQLYTTSRRLKEIS